jgi:hypothetical protein
MDNVHNKRNLTDVYSSADEERDDVNELQDEYESESVSSEEIEPLFGLEVGDVFESWDYAGKQVESCAKYSGFEVTKFRLEKNKEGDIVRRTFKCKFSGVYRAQKRADIEDTRERESVKSNCPWNINLRLTGGLIYVTSLCNEHNHFLEKENLLSNHHLGPEILEEIKFLVNVGCGAGPIIRALQKRFPETVIHPKYVYNAICRFRNSQNKSKSDAAETFEKLMKLQREEHGWFVKARLEGEDNHLTGLFWMRPSQIELWRRFHDVAINDNTSQTNKYRMYLSLTIIVDNHARSRMVATAVVSDETKETYQWILECLLSATDNLAPNVLFTDADPAMVSAIHETLPSTKHNYCIWHLRKNLDKNLRGRLRKNYNGFVKAWNKCRNSFSENEFQKRWRELLANYPVARKYLKRALGQVVTSWALCHTSRSFNAGIQSTQRVEGYNSLIKRSVKSSTTLFELDTHIQVLLAKEEQFERNEQSNQNPTVGLPNIVGRYFKRIDAIIKKFLTPRVLKMQHSQMNESLLYRANKVENWKDLPENEVKRNIGIYL